MDKVSQGTCLSHLFSFLLFNIDHKNPLYLGRELNHAYCHSYDFFHGHCISHIFFSGCGPALVHSKSLRNRKIIYYDDFVVYHAKTPVTFSFRKCIPVASCLITVITLKSNEDQRDEVFSMD